MYSARFDEQCRSQMCRIRYGVRSQLRSHLQIRGPVVHLPAAGAFKQKVDSPTTIARASSGSATDSSTPTDTTAARQAAASGHSTPNRGICPAPLKNPVWKTESSTTRPCSQILLPRQTHRNVEFHLVFLLALTVMLNPSPLFNTRFPSIVEGFNEAAQTHFRSHSAVATDATSSRRNSRSSSLIVCPIPS